MSVHHITEAYKEVWFLRDNDTEDELAELDHGLNIIALVMRVSPDENARMGHIWKQERVYFIRVVPFVMGPLFDTFHQISHIHIKEFGEFRQEI